MRRALAAALVLVLSAGLVHAKGRTGSGRKPRPAPSPRAERDPAPASPATPAPPPPEMLARRAEVRAAIDAGAFDRARALAARPVPRGQPKDRELPVLLAEVDLIQLKPADAAHRLAPLVATDRRAAWYANLAALALGDRKAADTLHALAAGTKPGEEKLAELGWLLEGTLPKIATTGPAPLEEAARTALDERRRPEAALALFACRRLGEETAKLQVLLDRLQAPR